MIRLSYILVFLSGATGLVYQVTWQKYLATLLGSHASSTASILALFFLFLSVGYALIGKFSTRIMKNQLGLYAAIEFLIGLYALYSPSIFAFLYGQFVSSPHLTSGGLTLALPLCATFIAIPTILMGGTIPVLTQALSSDFAVSGRVHAQIYGVNTLGAVIGCVAAGFYFLEKWGLADTLLFAGNVNILIGIAAGLVIYFSRKEFRGPEHQASVAQSGLGVPILSLYLISFLSGFYTFSLENLVMRMAGLAIGSTTYTYTIVVGAFILAIALGSIWLARRPQAEKPAYFSAVQVSSLLGVVFLYITIPLWPEWFLRLRLIFQNSLLNFDIYWFFVFLFSVVLLIVPIGLIGANLPLLFTLLRSRNLDLSQSVGRLYAVNCVGSTVGAVLGGYLIFHWLDAGAAFLVVIGSVTLATVLAGFTLLSGHLRTMTVLGALAVFGATLFLPSWKHSDFVPGLFSNIQAPQLEQKFSEVLRGFRGARNKILFSRFDPNTFAAVVELGKDNRGLYVNGKPDAVVKGDHTARAMAALTPMAIKPDPVKKVFIVGLGAGLSTGIFSTFKEVDQIDVAEISEGVVQSLPQFEPFNYGLKDNHQKVHIEVGDAYKVLMSKKEVYDLVVCEPSNPWVTGIEKLFTEEFYDVVKQKLPESGLFVQWFPLGAITPGTLRMILYTFGKVFPFHAVFSAHGGALTMIGGKKPLVLNPAVSRARVAEVPQIYKDLDITDAGTVWLSQILTPFHIGAISYKEEHVHSLFNPTLEYRSGRAYFASVSTNLNDVLTQAMVLPIDRSKSADRQFLVEPLLPQISELALREALDQTSSYWTYQWVWLVKMAREKFPKSTKFTEEFKNFADYAFLLGWEALTNPKWLKKPEQKFPRLQGLLQNFRQLVAIGEQPALSRLLPLIEKDCSGEECIKLKRVAVLTLGQTDDIKKITEMAVSEPEFISAEQAGLVEKSWQRIKGTYRKLGYDKAL